MVDATSGQLERERSETNVTRTGQNYVCPVDGCKQADVSFSVDLSEPSLRPNPRNSSKDISIPQNWLQDCSAAIRQMEERQIEATAFCQILGDSITVGGLHCKEEDRSLQGDAETVESKIGWGDHTALHPEGGDIGTCGGVGPSGRDQSDRTYTTDRCPTEACPVYRTTPRSPNQQNAETNVNFSSEQNHWKSNNRCNIRKPTMSQAIENLRILWSAEKENDSEIDFACFQSSSAAMPTKIAFYENGKRVIVHLRKKPCLLDLVPIVTSTVRFTNLKEQAQRLNLPIDPATLLLWKWIETDTRTQRKNSNT